MPSFLNPNTLAAFGPQQIRTLAETVLQEVFEAPEFESVHTVVNGITVDTQVAVLGRLNKITKKDAGCGLGAITKAIGASGKIWTPVQTKIWLKYCHTDFDSTFFAFLKHVGKKVADFTDTQIADFIIGQMKEAAIKDAFRIAWFNDVNHTAVGAGSGTQVLTAGTDITDYNIINGFWKQIFAIVAADSTRRVAIPQNAEATRVLQNTWVTADKPATKIYGDLLAKAHPLLKAKEGKVIFSTSNLMDQYANELESQALDASYERIEGGYDILKRRGYTIVARTDWDNTILSDFMGASADYLPHRALLTTKENLQIGLDDAGAIGDFDVFYDRMSETGNFKGAYKVDAKIAQDYLIQVAY